MPHEHRFQNWTFPHSFNTPRPKRPAPAQLRRCMACGRLEERDSDEQAWRKYSAGVALLDKEDG